MSQMLYVLKRLGWVRRQRCASCAKNSLQQSSVLSVANVIVATVVRGSTNS